MEAFSDWLALASAQPVPSAIVLALTLFALSVFLRPRDPPPIRYSVSVPEQCKPGWRGKELAEPSLKVPGSSVVQCYAPATGEDLGIVNPSTAEGIDRAVKKAKEAQVEWAKTSFAQRRRVLRSMLNYILDNQDPIAQAACLDSGKTKLDACFGEILVTAEKLRWTLKHGEQSLKPESRPTSPLMLYKDNEVRWEPLGVVAACVSWNYPFHNLLNPIISSIFAGNSIIVKGSEATAWSSTYFISIARNAISACGHDPNIVQSITCWPSVANHLTSHPDIAHLTFIGSRPVAHAVASSASKSLTPLCVELGGKDAAIILDDIADSKSELNRVASILLRGVYQSAGQNCIGIERIIACQRAYEKLIAIMEPRVKALRVGSALTAIASSKKKEDQIDVGACISDNGFNRLESLIEDAVSRGAKLLVGGKRYINPLHPKGHYFQPTLLVDVTPDMPIAQTELFAPIAILIRADSTSHAVALANGTEYALGSSLFARYPGRAEVQQAVRDIKAGMVSVNDFAAYYVTGLPFGGVKGSGYGRFGGPEGLRSVSNQKSVCVDRWPAIMRTAIPGPLDLPVGVSEGAWEIGKALCEIVYGSWGTTFRGVRRLVGI